MKLERQHETNPVTARSSVARRVAVVHSKGDRGYAMAALLITMSVMAIMMTVALPTWRQMTQREKEAELVFRGEQYARALTLFQSKNGPGTTPPTFDLLVEQRFLRKKYKDPITNDDFAPMVLGATQTPGTATTPGTAAGGRGGTQQQIGVQTGQRSTGTPGAAPTVPSGGIVGVTSKSKEQSIRLYKGRNHYNEWLFTPAPRVAAPGAGGQGAPGVGGQRGGNQGPQGPQNPFGRGGRGNQPPGGRGPFGPAGPNPNGPNPGPQRGQQPFPFPPPPRSGR
jgi:type II secretory pathway pseudopilin PulG